MKFILRLDDICPTMDWNKFARLEAMLNLYGHIKPVMGVIPQNRDPKLQIHPNQLIITNYIRSYS